MGLFLSKARTLESLQSRIQTARVAPLVYFNWEDWQENPLRLIEKARAKLPDYPWIIRSSCGREDQQMASSAGAFLSILGVNEAEVQAAIDDVFRSYGEPSKSDEVLLQPMLQNVLRSGVAFSHDPHTASPYRVVNWSNGANTTAITAGGNGEHWQQAASSDYVPPREIASVVAMLDELCDAYSGCPLDCEFAFTEEQEGETLWLLQVRPLIISAELETVSTQTARLQSIAFKIQMEAESEGELVELPTIYGVMPDWNPAEMIGIRPRRLALSLYRTLITDGAWAERRYEFGYRDLRNTPLMLDFCGVPYIDVGRSFRSLTPRGIPDELARQLGNCYLERLRSQPSLHDKVEFRVLHSCYDFDADDQKVRLRSDGFDSTDVERVFTALHVITSRLITDFDHILARDLAKLQLLTTQCERLAASYGDPQAKLGVLLGLTRDLGAIPFAGLARIGFIAMSLLKSLSKTDVLQPAEVETLLDELQSVGQQISHDFNDLEKAQFLAKYGHLRPGTYDLLSPSYAEKPEKYFDWTTPSRSKPRRDRTDLEIDLVKLDWHMDNHGLPGTGEGLIRFILGAIRGRERAKFEYSKAVSAILSQISDIGRLNDISPEQLSFVEVDKLLTARTRDDFDEHIARGKEDYQATLHTSLPPLITSPSEVYAFSRPNTVPNFITQGSAIGHPTKPERGHQLADGIVFIPNADPGFDWIFTWPIKGFVTAWGGANSHMAIRASELKIPAVIGAGQSAFELWSYARQISIDCLNEKVDIIV